MVALMGIDVKVGSGALVDFLLETCFKVLFAVSTAYITCQFAPPFLVRCPKSGTSISMPHAANLPALAIAQRDSKSLCPGRVN